MSSNKNVDYTVAELKKQFSKFEEAKKHFGLKARSWQALVDKLNAPGPESLKEQIEKLKERVAELEQENAQLRASVSVSSGFDEVGFWLLDRNFERAKFEDFGLDEEATEVESTAKAEYKKLAQKYHPDNKGTVEQMSNVNRLYQQMLSLVEINGETGL